MPSFIIDPAVPMDLTAIKQQFNDNVFGQEKAVDSIVNLLASVKTALTKTGKPIASFLFVGPTGVGKTELAKVLAQFMFGHRDKMVRFDMSEYADAYSVMRLTGLSYGSDGLLTAAVRRTPFCVLLFDEIEKAHTNFFDLLLQILSEGRLTDSSGRLVNFCSTIIIMTSNIGASNLQSNRISLQQTVASEA
ncbi:MAG: AAA family ATPase, partial [Bacteroidota bacterium]